MKQKHRFVKYFVIVIIICVLVFGVDLVLSQKYISITSYICENNKIKQNFKIVHLTDLHNYQFGSKNQRLISKVKTEAPDVIFLTGDMLNADEERTDILTDLIRQLVLIAPVYASLGNHEIEYVQLSGNRDLIAQMEEAGAVVLDKEYLDMEINGQEVRLGGVYGYVLSPDDKEDPEQTFMKEFQDTDRFKILLSHVPEGLLLWKSMEHWDVDLVFSGHVHGGQVRIPFVGGLYDPEEGYFPTYTKGMFECGNGTMVLSAGLGSSRGVPRVNNLPELVVCEVKGEK
ncbi:MAG: metallophosphoesterase [Blautia sp.]|uniref:metallophosphoesterase n=1 Tax=Blautia sp. TaxID=1955243 RepID=UPI0039968CEE